MNNELISVLMPAFNAEKYIAQAIESILGQTYLNVEIVIVDDGSSDNTREIISQYAQKYPNKITTHFQEKKGQYATRNATLRLATGQYVAFLDADDYWDIHFLEKLYATLQSNQADLAYCGWQNFGIRQGDPFLPPEYEKDDPIKHFLKGNLWPIHAVLVRNNILEKANYFSERYTTSMDYDLWLRVFTITNKFIRIPEVLVYYRWHNEGQVSQVKWKQLINAANIKMDFISNNHELVGAVDQATQQELIFKPLLDAAYQSFWKRDLISAQKLFRKCFAHHYFSIKDIKYIILSLMPLSFLNLIIKKKDGDI